MENKITVLLVSFLRCKYTMDCINSLRDTYPNINIIVGEHGIPRFKLQKLCEKNNCIYKVFPFDSGLPFVRNRLFEMAKTPYVLVGDDDFFYNREANLDLMVDFLENNDFDIIGGRVREKGVVKDWQGDLVITKSRCVLVKISAEDMIYQEYNGLKYTQVDMMTNFWIGKREKLPLWEEDQKIYHEHTDYMYSLKGKLKMAFTPQAIVDHKLFTYDNPEYRKYRFRKTEKNHLTKKYNLNFSSICL